MAVEFRASAPLFFRSSIAFVVIAAVALPMLEPHLSAAIVIAAAMVATAAAATQGPGKTSVLVEAAWPFVAVLLFLAEANPSLMLFAAAGLQLAVSLAIVVSVARDGELPLFPATSILAGVLAWRFVGIEAFAEEAIVAAGCMALFAAVASKRSIRLDALAVVILFAVIAPSASLRAATIPLVVAATFAAIRFVQGGAARVAVLWLPALAVLISLAAGKWALLISLAAFVPLVPDRRVSGEARFAMPPFAAGGAMAVRGLLLDPLLFLRAARSSLWRRAVVVVWLIAAVVAERPQLGIVYVLAAALLVATDGSLPARRNLTPLAAVAAAAFLLLPWSAASLPLLPFAAPIGVVAMLVAVVAISVGHFTLFRSLAAAALALVVFSTSQRPVLERLEPLVMVGAGESCTLPLPRPAREIDLFVWGANVASLRDGVSVGWIDMVAADGSGRSREIDIGDFADWGAWRRTQIFATHNPVVRSAGGGIEGVGRGAVLFGSGKIRITSDVPLNAVRLRVGSLPPGSGLVLEKAEVLKR